jgi:hypothetical protein
MRVRRFRNSMQGHKDFLQIKGSLDLSTSRLCQAENAPREAGAESRSPNEVGIRDRTRTYLREQTKTRMAGVRQFVQVGVITASILIGGGLGATVSAATYYYVSPSGSDASAGTSSAPWKTFKFAIPKLRPGDTLVLRDGTYNKSNSGYPQVICASTGSNAVSGTASQRITLRAENERRAFIAGDGSAYPLEMISCAYWTIQGLRLEGGDFQASSLLNGHTVSISNSNNITFRRNLVRFNNRYKNGNIVSFSGSTDSLIEENEVYSFHRSGLGGGNSNIYRRNYLNSRGRTDIAGGYTSTNSTRGDAAYIFYPSSNNLVENNISEGSENGFHVVAIGLAKNNRFYGNISLNDLYGGSTTARGSGTNLTPVDNLFENFVATAYANVGLNARGARNTQCNNCSFLGSTSSINGVAANVSSSNPGDGGPYSIFGTNILARTHNGTGVIITKDINQWAFQAINSFAGTPNYNPASSSNYTNKQSIDPQLGACKVFIPEGSPMKGAGKNGADIGANVLYRYQNGVLTSQPLWDPQTGRFPCGATIPGVNDIVGSSCFDVHKRLNVNANGCSLPSGYGQQSVTVATPQNLRIIGSD